MFSVNKTKKKLLKLLRKLKQEVDYCITIHGSALIVNCYHVFSGLALHNLPREHYTVSTSRALHISGNYSVCRRDVFLRFHFVDVSISVMELVQI